MSNATINLNAVDNTRAAFLSVQQRLRQMEGASAMASRNILRMGFGIVGAAGVGRLVSQQIREVIKNIESMPGIPNETAASVLALRNRFKDLAETGRQVIASLISGFVNFSQYAGITVGAMVYGTEAAAGALDEIKKGQQEALDAARIAAFNEKIKDLVAELGKTKKAAEAAFVWRSVTDNPVQRAKELWAELDRVNQALEDIANTTTTGDEEAIQKIKATIELYNQKIQIGKELEKNQKEIGKAAREAATILSEGFEDAIFSGRKLSDVVRQLAMDLVKMAFRSTITAPLGKALGGFFGGLSIFGGARASGGPVGVGKSYLVGERGPEIFTPSSAGNVISHEKSFGGGGGATYYIDARGADQTGLARLEAMIRQTQASIVPIALGAVMNAKARGSAFYA
jgi:hypothetical protein